MLEVIIVERGDSRHGQAKDDELAAHAQHPYPGPGSRDPEAPVEGEPGSQLSPDMQRVGTPEGMTPEDVEGRAELARFLDTGKFPVTAVQIREMSDRAQVPDPVRLELASLPPGNYQSVTQVWEALGHGVERPRDTDS